MMAGSFRVLLVDPDPEIQGQVKTAGNEVETDLPLMFDTVTNEAEARQHVESWTPPFDLVITRLDIPTDLASPIDDSQQRGFELIRWIRAKYPDLRCVVLANSATPIVAAAIEAIGKCALVQIGERTHTEVCDAIQEAMSVMPERDERGPSPTDRPISKATPDISPSSRKRQPKVDVEIRLGETSSYYIHCEGVVFDTEIKNLKIAHATLRELSERSQELVQHDPRRSYDSWVRELRRIGQRLGEELFKNLSFTEDFREALGRVGGDLRNTRVSLVVPDRRGDYEAIYPITLEALTSRDAHGFWMLEAPITRKIGINCHRCPLFWDEETQDGDVNCLIIVSDVPEIGRLPKLDNIEPEAEWLEDFLRSDGLAVRPKRVKVIREAPNGGKSFRREVEKTLASGPWHLVHYAGHSEVEDDAGYVFFPPDEKVRIDTFARWLNDAQFVYLSSCHSSEDSIVFELAHRAVPAIVGFRWDIDDEIAVKHTKAFYRELFRSLRLEMAFLKARLAIHEEFDQDDSWAAPMLVLQMAPSRRRPPRVA